MKNYIYIMVVILTLLLVGCNNKSKVEAIEEPIFNDTLNGWYKKLDGMVTEYTRDYNLQLDPYSALTYKDKVEGLNLMRSDWNAFNKELTWNPKTTKEEQILEVVDRITFNFEYAIKYKSSYFNYENSNDRQMMNRYEKELSEDISYFGTLAGY